MKAFLALVFVVASVYGQECQQTCSPQPVVIQLSCGDGGQTPQHPPPNHNEEPHHPPPQHEDEPHYPPAGPPPHHEEEPHYPPAGPPPHHEEEPHYPPAGPPPHQEEEHHNNAPGAPPAGPPPQEEEHHNNAPGAPPAGPPPQEEEHHNNAPGSPPAGPPPQEEEDMPPYEQLDNICQFDHQGRPITHPPGGWPEGFLMQTAPDGSPRPGQFPPAGHPIFTEPPQHWDGSAETLGFPMPPRGTPQFNMLMCWPIMAPSVGQAAPMAG